MSLICCRVVEPLVSIRVLRDAPWACTIQKCQEFADNFSSYVSCTTSSVDVIMLAVRPLTLLQAPVAHLWHRPGE